MIVGVPREIKDGERRVALAAPGVDALVRAGHEVLVEAGAGSGSGIPDDEYREHGAQIVDAADAWDRADMVVKVKEPLESEYDHLRPGLVLFTYLHLASSRSLTEVLLEREVTGIAYETVQSDDGRLPLLEPMSEVAGKLATQVGAHCLESASHGRGILLGGVTGVPPAEVVIIGAGTVGQNAAHVALGLGAQVTLLDIDARRLRHMEEITRGKLITMFSNPYAIARCARFADLLVGAVLVPGARAPMLVTEEMVRAMKPGAARRGALRGTQHARAGAAHLDLRAHQRDAALRGAHRRPGPRGRVRAGPRTAQRPERHGRGDQSPRSGRGVPGPRRLSVARGRRRREPR